MYVTKANMAAAVANLIKNLEQVSETLAVSLFIFFALCMVFLVIY